MSRTYKQDEIRRGNRAYPEESVLVEFPVILCVDDEVWSAVALRRLVLLNAGYQVVTAADGAAALELFLVASR